MYVDKARFRKHGSISLIGENANGKRIRIPAPSHIKTLDEAERYCSLKNAEGDAAKFRALKRLEWRSKFYDFGSMIAEFEKYAQKSAPNSWENTVYYLQAYVFHFFLDLKECSNLNNWTLFFGAYREWLETVKPIKSKRGEKDRIAVSTRNHCIKSLNRFLDFAAEKGLMERVLPCRTFSRRLVKRKTIDNVMNAEVQHKIHEQLSAINPIAADFYLFLCETGEREAEGLGMSLADLFQGKPESPEVADLLARHSLEPYGYVVLESQVSDPVRIYDHSGKVPRRALKHREEIKYEFNRTIPILSKEIFNMLVVRWQIQNEKFGRRERGGEMRDYLLFEGLNKNTFYNDLAKACRMAKVRHHSPHDSRHTASTRIVGLTRGDLLLAQMILGHRDPRETEGYSHLYASIQRDLLRAQQQRRGLNFVD